MRQVAVGFRQIAGNSLQGSYFRGVAMIKID